jgi:AraC-like DNA-binding protein
MTPTLSSELQHALDQSGGQPLRVEDPRTRKAYALVEWNVARTWIETRREADGDWSEKKNARRCELIRKKFADGLTPAETAELDQLQEQVGQFREQFGPLAADTVRALEAELQRIRSPQSGSGASG